MDDNEFRKPAPLLLWRGSDMKMRENGNSGRPEFWYSLVPSDGEPQLSEISRLTIPASIKAIWEDDIRNYARRDMTRKEEHISESNSDYGSDEDDEVIVYRGRAAYARQQ